MVNVGDTLENGATAFAVLHTGAGSLVLAKREDMFMSWVTWRVDEDGNCEWGQYAHTPEQATADFQKRSQHLLDLAGFYHLNLGV